MVDSEGHKKRVTERRRISKDKAGCKDGYKIYFEGTDVICHHGTVRFRNLKRKGYSVVIQFLQVGFVSIEGFSMKKTGKYILIDGKMLY